MSEEAQQRAAWGDGDGSDPVTGSDRDGGDLMDGGGIWHGPDASWPDDSRDDWQTDAFWDTP